MSEKIKSFKKFSDLSKTTIKLGEEKKLVLEPQSDKDLPCNHNLPQVETKTMVNMSTSKLMPNGQDRGTNDVKEVKENMNLRYYGKVVQLPKGSKASSSFRYLENNKVPKSSVWYIMVEKQDNELQMLKYNYQEGVNLATFVNELKTYYLSKYGTNTSIVEMINKIEVDGTNDYSLIKNIPPISVDGKKMISKITEDLIHLLSK